MENITIGKVNIDLSEYPGEDFYSEGEIEDRLLLVSETRERSEFRKVTEENASWPYLYHFSPNRENIVSWLPIKKTDKVLEIGAGMGAITNALCAKAASVESVDLSLKRSKVNANRNKDMENLTIKVGNFTDIEPKLSDDYDWIMLIGVFEYAISYIHTEHPFEDFLGIIKKHVKKDGRIVIAIENRLGLKYFAGCKEDHTTGFFDGVENYKKGGQVRTFSRKGLEKIFEKVDITNYHFYYPYPDYKLPNAVFSDKRLPKKGELKDNLRNFDQDRLLLFDETNAFDGMIEEGMFPDFSNSYEVIIGDDVSETYAKYSTDRDDKFAIVTKICEEKEKKYVVKRAYSEKGLEHIENINKAYDKLTERFELSGLKFNKIIEYNKEKGEIVFEYVEGETLESLMDECVRKNDKDGFVSLFEKFKEFAYFNEDKDVVDDDLIFSNIIVKDGVWTAIDYEWTRFVKGSSAEVVYRAINNYLCLNNFRNAVKDWIDTDNDFEENLFMKKVMGENVPMPTIRHNIGKGVYELSYLTDRVSGLSMKVQIYEDFGEGFTEENSYFLSDIKKYGPSLLLEIPIKEGTKSLRVDPGDRPARFYVNQIFLNDKDVTNELMGLSKNGCLNPKTSIQKNNTVIFKTNDPHIKFNLKSIGAKEGDLLKIDCRVEYIM